MNSILWFFYSTKTTILNWGIFLFSLSEPITKRQQGQAQTGTFIPAVALLALDMYRQQQNRNRQAQIARNDALFDRAGRR